MTLHKVSGIKGVDAYYLANL